MKNKKLKIELSHPLREMLAEVFLGLENFDISTESRRMIMVNRKSNNDSVSTVWKSGIQSRIGTVITEIQKKIGLINFRFYVGKDECNIVCAHGGFLITNKPYVTYIEKATQLYGYTGKNYGKFISKIMLNYFLKNKNLKKIFFLSEAALKGMINTPGISERNREIIQKKGMVVYPPIVNSVDNEKFENIDKGINFIFISSSFYGKGGPALVEAFDRLCNAVNNTKLILIVDIEKVDSVDLKKVKINKNIEIHDYKFTKEELFDRFLNKCHVLCYPTYSDSYSAVVSEAIAASMPVITSDFYSIPERVIDGYNGFLFSSPFPNYDENFVIQEDHFTDIPEFMNIISDYQKKGKLDYVTEFLFEKMKFLAINKSELKRMSINSKKVYDEKLNSDKIRKYVNNMLLEALE